MSAKKLALELEVKIKKGDITLGELSKEIENLGATIDEQKDILLEFEKELLQIESIQAKTSKTDLARQAALKQRSDQLKGAIKDQKLSIKELTTAKNKASSASKDLTKETLGEGDAIKALDGVTGGAASKFKNLKGVLGSVIKSFKTLKGAIAASGIGLLALAVAAVGAAFTSSEEGQNKFAKIMGVIGALTGNLIDLLADLGEKIISVFENPKKALTDFSNLIRDNIKNQFEGLLELVPKLGEAITLLFKGEFSAAGKVAVDAVGKVALGVEGVTDKVTSATKAIKEFAAEQIKEGNAAAKVADMRAKADKIDRDLTVKRSQLESKIAQLRLKARQEDSFSAAERKAALIEAQKLENTLLDSETKALVLRRDAQKLENTFSRTNKENLDKEAEAVAAVNNQVARRATVARTLQRELNTINGQIEAENKETQARNEEQEKEAIVAREAIRQALIDTEAERRQEELDAVDRQYKELIKLAEKYGGDIDDLQKTQQAKKDAIIKKNAESDAAKLKADADKILKEQESLIKSLEFKQEKEENDFNLRREEVDRREKLLLADKTLTEQQRSELEKQFAAERVKITQDEEALRAEISQQRLQMASDILGAINGLAQSFAKKDEESQRKAFNLNKAFSAGQVILSTAVGVANALTAGGNPIKLASGAQFVEAGIVAATGAAQFTAIQRSQFGGGSSPQSLNNPSIGGGNAGTQPIGFTPSRINQDTPTTKVIVTETDIRKATTDISGIYNKAIVVE